MNNKVKAFLSALVSIILIPISLFLLLLLLFKIVAVVIFLIGCGILFWVLYLLWLDFYNFKGK